ncbi:Ribonuclease/ribotoxin [Jackrogersella minutella]|nr:Ribonuclease/ribotoxin [Jackrogersella minutella]
MYFTSSFSLLPLVAFLTSVAAAPLEERAATTCGSTYYSADQVNQASQRACSNYNSGNTPGGYPHTYNNYEGFSFAVEGPYLEFPILSSGLYTGGSPGADRVVINQDCSQAGAITHTGASGNNFVGCSGTS